MPGVATTLAITLNVPSNAAPNASNLYNVNLTVADSSGQPSQKLTLPVTVVQDFSVSCSVSGQSDCTTSPQSVSAGNTAGPFNLTVATVGTTFNNAVTLACSSGLPALAQCLFNPSAPITPASGPQIVVMNISTTAPTAGLFWPEKHRSIFYALWLMPGIVIVLEATGRTSRRKRCWLGATVLLVLSFVLSSCGGGGAGGGGGGGNGHQGTKPGTYTITVIGTSGSLSHSTTVGLVVQ
jgi:hypothetical protein